MKTIAILLFTSAFLHFVLFSFIVGDSAKLHTKRGVISVDITSKYSYVNKTQAKVTLLKSNLTKKLKKIKNFNKHKLNRLQEVKASVGKFYTGIVKIYPLKSRIRKEEGQVLVVFDKVKGNILNVKIKRSSGFSLLDQAAIDSLHLSKTVFKDKLDQEIVFSFSLNK